MASGDTLAIFTPYNNEPPSSNYATLDTRNQHPILDFDATTDEEAVFKGIMPQSYAGTTGVTVYIHYAMSTANGSVYVVWQAAFERVSDSVQDIDSDGFEAFNSTGQVAVPGTLGHVDVASIAFTDGSDMDSVVAGDGFRLKIRRDADGTSADDDATGDAELWAVEIRET